MSTVYDPTIEEFYDPEDGDRPAEARALGIRGEGNPADWLAFAEAIQSGRYRSEQTGTTKTVMVDPGEWEPLKDVAEHPDVTKWDQIDGYWRGKASPRGYYLFVGLAVRPHVSSALQGLAGWRGMGTDPDDYMDPSTPGDPEQERIDLYADGLAGDGLVQPHGMFEEPGRLPAPVIELDDDGMVTGYQEGRHRSLAAEQAGLEWMPIYVFREVQIDRWDGDPTTYYP